jgi:hypothetical protein
MTRVIEFIRLVFFGPNRLSPSRAVCHPLPDNWVAKSVAKHEGAGGAAFDGSPEHVLAWRLQDDLPSFTASVPSEAGFFAPEPRNPGEQF